MKPTVITLHEGALEHPDRPRFQLPGDGAAWVPVTWAEIDTAVSEVGLGLESLGLPVGRPCAVFAPNSMDWLYAALGIQAASGVMVPIYPSNTAEQAGYVLDHAEAFAVFVDTLPLLERTLRAGSWTHLRHVVVLSNGLDVEAALERARSESVDLPDDIADRLTTLPELRARGRSQGKEAYKALLGRIERSQSCLMLYTSGTTGQPKGVPLTYENVNSNSEDWLQVLGPAMPDERIDLFWLPMSHIFGWGEACLGFELGFTSFLTTPKDVMSLFTEVRPTIFMSVPAYWEKLAAGALEAGDPQAAAARLCADSGGRLSFCLSGGAGLDLGIKTLFESAGLLIIEGYGLTESSPTLTMNRPGDYRFDSVGKAFPRVQLKLAEDGEILAKGPNVFGGYHKDPEATARTFTDDGWLATGDLGRLTEDGFLQIVGRKKEILVTAGGKNIAPVNIETHFASDELIDHLVVYGDGKKYLVAGVWASELARARHAPEALEAEVQRRVRAVNAKLARHETIKRFALMEPPLSIEGGLLTPTLKIKRKKIYEAFQGTFEGLYA